MTVTVVIPSEFEFNAFHFNRLWDSSVHIEYIGGNGRFVVFVQSDDRFQVVRLSLNHVNEPRPSDRIHTIGFSGVEPDKTRLFNRDEMASPQTLMVATLFTAQFLAAKHEPTGKEASAYWLVVAPTDSEKIEIHPIEDLAGTSLMFVEGGIAPLLSKASILFSDGRIVTTGSFSLIPGSCAFYTEPRLRACGYNGVRAYVGLVRLVTVGD